MKKFIFTISLLLITTTVTAEIYNGMPADIVLGQPDFTSNTSNNGGISSKSLGGARSMVFSTGKKFFVADNGNRRVLIWNKIPTSNFEPADVVVGQLDFTSAAVGVNQININTPRGIWVESERLFIADQSGNRILIWNKVPQTNGVPADVVVGQPDFVTNNCVTSQTEICTPRKALVAEGRLYISDRIGNRLLVYNKIPTTNGAAADHVVGQANFTDNGASVTRSTFNAPTDMYYDGNKFFVCDQVNNRILIYNSPPTDNFAFADVVVGQPDFTSNSNGSGISQFNEPRGVYSDGVRLFVTDRQNNRVLVWNQIPTTNGAPADFVLGQPDFSTTSAGTSSTKMSNIARIHGDGKRIFVSEEGNNRVLIFDNISGENLELGPQFDQGKGVLGKVFADHNGDGWQDAHEFGLEGVKVAADTGVYAITDEDGKYHFPFIEVGQHVLKIDEDTLPIGSSVTTDNPRRIIVTEGILTKVSFGVDVPESFHTNNQQQTTNNDSPFLKVQVSQDASILKPRLAVSSKRYADQYVITIDTNYFLFIDRAKLKVLDENYNEVLDYDLPGPISSEYELEISDLPNPYGEYYYQLSVFDRNGNEDRTGIGKL